MSMPNIPNIDPNITLDMEDSIKLLLNSLALNELGLSHIINAEGEKLQYVLGTLENKIKNSQQDMGCESIDPDKLIDVNNSVKGTLREVLRNQMILQMKMEDALSLYNVVNATKKKDFDDNENICIERCEDSNEDGIDCSPVYF